MRNKFYSKILNGHYLQRIDHELFYQSRLRRVIKRSKNIVEKLSIKSEYIVQNGAFKGLQYPSLDITEAALAPKIIGSYEYQLQPWFNKIISTNYSDIIDIGSAEGYYAVGLAKKMPSTTVHCYDINEKDIEFSKLMAAKNNVRNITWNTFCDQNTLLHFPFHDKSLILCDCEGYEFELFTDSVISKCSRVDFLIELHNVFNPMISSALLSRFQHTHTFSIVNNINVDYSTIRGIHQLTPDEREFALCEHRGGLYQNIYMEWVFLKSKEIL
jgi:hypothetical protein